MRTLSSMLILSPRAYKMKNFVLATLYVTLLYFSKIVFGVPVIKLIWFLLIFKFLLITAGVFKQTIHNVQLLFRPLREIKQLNDCH